MFALVVLILCASSVCGTFEHGECVESVCNSQLHTLSFVGGTCSDWRKCAGYEDPCTERCKSGSGRIARYFHAQREGTKLSASPGFWNNDIFKTEEDQSACTPLEGPGPVWILRGECIGKSTSKICYTAKETGSTLEGWALMSQTATCKEEIMLLYDVDYDSSEAAVSPVRIPQLRPLEWVLISLIIGVLVISILGLSTCYCRVRSARSELHLDAKKSGCYIRTGSYKVFLPYSPLTIICKISMDGHKLTIQTRYSTAEKADCRQTHTAMLQTYSDAVPGKKGVTVWRYCIWNLFWAKEIPKFEVPTVTNDDAEWGEVTAESSSLLDVVI